ncbi:hypothetical protein QFC20_006722 [Naganishia adeliensis]|uniref:Uncharacterized protein n=1 Tax=Naganishia adeliensis TaxID=92952 RepID=A0ACC2V722_9TREE|nr:hypothetical protein QFC20_006722 [Naganishia adeliensis]
MSHPQTSIPRFQVSRAEAETFAKADLDHVLQQLTLDEKIALLTGADWWTTANVPRLGIPHIKCSDGPNGVRGSSHLRMTPANCTPCGTAVAATFDVDQVARLGGMLAREAKAKGVSLLLGPTCNISRHPGNGRASESFSEDPFLSGLIASAYVNGLREEGVGAVIKHFVCNEMEAERTSVSVEVTERALREIYLMPFMMAQKHALPWSFMSAYSRLNGTHCSESERLLQDILREEWKFDGLVMFDWTGTYSTDAALLAGMDLEMPGPTRYRGGLIKHQISCGKLTMRDLEKPVMNVLKLIQRATKASIDTVINNTRPEIGNDNPQDRQINRETAAAAIVLLKNSANVLPVQFKKGMRIAVLGPNAKARTVSSGGSAYLASSYVVTAYDAIKEAADKIGAHVEYAAGCYIHRYTPLLDGWIRSADGHLGWDVAFYNAQLEDLSEDNLVEKTVLHSTRMRLNDDKPTGLRVQFSIIATGYITPDTTGVYQFGLVLVGRACLYVDGELVIDNGMSTQNKPFYGLGTEEVRGDCTLTAGKRHRVEIRHTNYPGEHTGMMAKAEFAPVLLLGAIRLGGCLKLADEEKAIEDAVRLAAESDVAFCFTGSTMDWEAEGGDRQNLHLPGRADELVERLLQVKPEAVISNQSGAVFHMPWAERTTTVMQTWFAGNETGNAILDVITGKVNPSGRLPMSWPKKIEDCTAHINWGAERGKVHYGEGVFVGYRGYEECKRDLTWNFGHGLSYSTFAWTKPRVDCKHSSNKEDPFQVDIHVTVRNTGNIAGAEVVQVYIRDVASSVRRPRKELKGVRRVFLQPREEREVIVRLDALSLSFYDEKERCWLAEKGTFDILLATSSAEEAVVHTLRLDLQSDIFSHGTC